MTVSEDWRFRWFGETNEQDFQLERICMARSRVNRSVNQNFDHDDGPREGYQDAVREKDGNHEVLQKNCQSSDFDKEQSSVMVIAPEAIENAPKRILRGELGGKHYH